jgi:malonyl-CoA/methylmalonyl-CoA synthetase
MHALCTAWEWTRDDRIIHILPLHHVHGILAILLCGLNSGATVTFLRKFDPHAVWLALAGQPAPLASTSGPAESKVAVPKPTLFMAVPTVYAKLLEHFHKQAPEVRPRVRRIESMPSLMGPTRVGITVQSPLRLLCLSA